MDFSISKLNQHHNEVIEQWHHKYNDLLNFFLSKNKIETMIDIGANTGGAIEFILSKTSINKLYAFEPVLENFNLLQTHLLTTKYANPVNEYTLFNKAIVYDNNTEVIEVWNIEDNPGTCFLKTVKDDGLLRLHGREGFYTGHTFSCTTLEKSLPNNILIDFCKIDVEGSEWNILEHSDFIKNNVKVIWVEYHWFNEQQSIEFVKKHLPMFNIINVHHSNIWLEKNEK